jgi:hypothetical protein
LSFARNEAEIEKPAALDLAALLQTVCEERPTPARVRSILVRRHAACFGHPTALYVVEIGDRLLLRLLVFHQFGACLSHVSGVRRPWEIFL